MYSIFIPHIQFWQSWFQREIANQFKTIEISCSPHFLEILGKNKEPSLIQVNIIINQLRNKSRMNK